MSTPAIPPAANAAQSWYSIRNEADAEEADARIYDAIGGWGITAQQFVDDLAKVKAKRINLHINSPGGSVWDGTAIHNALKAHAADIVVHVDGIAASIASVVAMAGDEIRIAKNAYMMIHDPSGGVWGNAGDMRKMADTLDKVRENIAETYAARAGGKKSKADFLEMMADTTWFTAKEAREAGLVDTVTDDEAAGVKNTLDLPVFAKAPADALRLIQNNGKPTAAGRPVAADDTTPTPATVQPVPAERKPAMATDNTAAAGTAPTAPAANQSEPKPATIAELKAAFPKDPAFALDCADKAYTLTEARAAYAAVLEAKLAAKDQELAAAKSQPAASAAPAPAAGNRPLGGNAATPAATAGAAGASDPVAEFNARVADAMKVQNLDRRRAVLAVAKADPELHADFLLATNSGRRQQELIRDRFGNA